MKLFDALFRRKKDSSIQETESPEVEKVSCLDNAALLADVVNSGLENQDYNEMHRKLSDCVQPENGSAYVFDCPAIRGIRITECIMLIAFVFSCYFIFIGAATVCFSDKLRIVGAGIFVSAMVVLVLNVFVVKRIRAVLKYKSRFERYAEMLMIKKVAYIEDLAACSNQEEKRVLNDLEKAVNEKLIPQGHFNATKLVFMVSNQIYENYMQKPAAYDRYFKEKAEERRRIRSRSDRVTEIMEKGEQYIKKFNDYKALINDKNVSHQIEHLENTVSMIFHEVDVNPKQADSLGVFLNYYLPTTDKLLNTYVSITENTVTVSELSKTKKEIEKAFITIIDSYDRILGKMYEEYEMDVSSDIEVMETMMKEDGLSV